MSKQTTNGQLFYKGITTLLAVMLLLILWGLPNVQASSLGNDDPEAYGHIDSFPSGLIGTWVVNGVTYQANGSTEFKQEAGAFAVGKCVKVRYVDSTSPFTINKVETENESDCGGNTTGTPDGTATTGTPEGTSTPDTTGTPVASATPSVTTTTTPNGTPGATQEVKGIVDAVPSPGLIGSWMIGGVEYVANGSTEFKQDDGPFVVGACVEVAFFTSTTPRVAHEIKTEKQRDCSGNGTGTPSGTPSGTGTPDGTTTPTPSVTSTPTNEREIYGQIDSFPSGLLGNWVVDGVTYQATNGSEFKAEHGPFVVGACVKVHVQTTSTPGTIREIETEQTYRCGSDGTATPEAELYGLLQSFPAELIGNWNIGGMTFVADSSTEFKQAHGAFVAGMTVKVHFSVQNGLNQAREIETKFANDSSGSDDDGNGSFEGSEGHAYSTIDSFPGGLIGVWQLGGIAYTANEQSTFAQSDGTFAVGVKVKVEYYLDTNGNRVVQKIETTSEDGGSSSPDRFKLFGFVNQMPANGFAGTWAVDHIAFVADANTQFMENNGLLSLGSFVAVEYFIRDGRNQIHEVETHVPPGAGDKSAIGNIQNGGAVNAAALASATTWVIGGKSYVVNPATDLNDVDGALTVGATALVNSYTAPDGSEVATQIRGVTLNQQLFLPLVAR